jgi:hypothetical protein
MSAVPNTVGFDEFAQRCDIALKRIKVDDQCGRCNVINMHPRFRRNIQPDYQPVCIRRHREASSIAQTVFSKLDCATVQRQMQSDQSKRHQPVDHPNAGTMPVITRVNPPDHAALRLPA